MLRRHGARCPHPPSYRFCATDPLPSPRGEWGYRAMVFSSIPHALPHPGFPALPPTPVRRRVFPRWPQQALPPALPILRRPAHERWDLAGPILQTGPSGNNRRCCHEANLTCRQACRPPDLVCANLQTRAVSSPRPRPTSRSPACAAPCSMKGAQLLYAAQLGAGPISRAALMGTGAVLVPCRALAVPTQARRCRSAQKSRPRPWQQI